MKTLNKVFSNSQIYDIAVKILNNFSNIEDVYLPAAVAFSIQKNKKMLVGLAEEIEQARISILSHYNTNDNDKEIKIAADKIEDANNELKALLDIRQELKIYTFKIEELDGVKFTSSQMDSILFMIDEE